MPKFLERKLMAEYGPNNPGAVYGTLNAIGAMRGSKETAKGRAMQKKHDAKGDKAAALASHPHAARLGKFLHPKKAR
jgi:hypothetical protein